MKFLVFLFSVIAVHCSNQASEIQSQLPLPEIGTSELSFSFHNHQTRAHIDRDILLRNEQSNTIPQQPTNTRQIRSHAVPTIRYYRQSAINRAQRIRVRRRSRLRREILNPTNENSHGLYVTESPSCDNSTLVTTENSNFSSDEDSDVTFI